MADRAKLRSVRSRILLAIAALVAAVMVIGQFAIPSIGEHRIESRLTQGGGSADVSLSAFPAVRLLFDDGDRIEVAGAGLDLPLEEETNAFEKLDGFDQVEVRLDSFRAGPFQVGHFALTRDGSAAYRLRSDVSTTGADLADFAASRAGLPNGPLFRFFEGQIPGASARIPIKMDMELESDGGRVRVVSGGATVAGVPTGPLAELITSMIVVRL
jgi:hypothetical protein